MKNSLSILILILIILPINLSAKTIREIFMEGNHLYREKKYDDALKKYKELIETFHIKNADIFYNVANCYAMEGRDGYAILNYIKALKHKPQDITLKRVKENLGKIRAKIMLKEEKGERKFLFDESYGLFHTLTNVISLTSAFYIFIVSEILFFLFLIFARLFLFKYHKIKSSIILLCLFLVVILSGTIGSGRLYLDGKYKEGVVVEDRIKMYEARDLQSPYLALPEGVSVRILKGNNPDKNYTQIELMNGKRGYVENGKVLAVND